MLGMNRWVLAAVIIVVLTPLALSGFLPNGNLGVSDWDYYFSYHHVVRAMTLEYGFMPQWNPYICGGTSAIGDPEFPLLAPTYLLELIFGIPLGFRLAIFVVTAASGIGILMLGKQLGFSVWAALLASLAYAFGSVNLLEIVEGHPNVFSAAYIPWILYFWHRAYTKGHVQFLLFNSQTVVLSVLLAAMFFQGGIYLLMYVAGAFLFFIAVARDKKKALLATGIAGTFALGLAAIKLVPVLMWLQQFQDQMYASSTFTLPYLHEIFLGRHLHGVTSENVIPDQGGGWHEYGAYLGPLVIALATLSLAKLWRDRLVQLLLLAAIISTIISSSGPLLKPFFDQVSFLPRSNISRLIIFAVIPLCLLAGIGLDFGREIIGRWVHRRWLLTAYCLLLTALVAADLMIYSNQLSKQAFVLPPLEDVIPAAAYPLQYTIAANTIRHEGVDYTRSYAHSTQGWGTQTYCTVLSPSPAVITYQDPEIDASMIFIANEGGSAELISWSPERVVGQITTTKPTDVILNANYTMGWTVNGEPAQEVSGRVAAAVPAGQQTLVFSYRAPGFTAGVTISAGTLLLLLFSTIKWVRSGQSSASRSTAVLPSR